jgi:hypothetical protein
MNDLELAISATLRADAQEAAMSTDTSHEYELLEGRMDDLDRRHRRRLWVGGIAAAAAVVLVVVGVRAIGVGVDGATPPAGPGPSSSPTPRFTSTAFTPATSLVVPEWIRQSHAITSGGHPGELTWRACWDSCPGVEPSTMLFLGIESVRTGRGSSEYTAVTSAQQVVDRLAEMQRLGEISLSDRTQVVVDGHPGTMFSAQEKATITDGFACESVLGTSCFDLNAGDWDRLVVLDYNSRVIVIVASTAANNPERPKIQAQFEQMLPTVRFGPVPSPGTS